MQNRMEMWEYESEQCGKTCMKVGKVINLFRRPQNNAKVKNVTVASHDPKKLKI